MSNANSVESHGSGLKVWRKSGAVASDLPFLGQGSISSFTIIEQQEILSCKIY